MAWAPSPLYVDPRWNVTQWKLVKRRSQPRSGDGSTDPPDPKCACNRLEARCGGPNPQRPSGPDAAGPIGREGPVAAGPTRDSSDSLLERIRRGRAAAPPDYWFKMASLLPITASGSFRGELTALALCGKSPCGALRRAVSMTRPHRQSRHGLHGRRRLVGAFGPSRLRSGSFAPGWEAGRRRPAGEVLDTGLAAARLRIELE
jgi:hypothetical protein